MYFCVVFLNWNWNGKIMRKNRRETKYYDVLIVVFVGLVFQKATENEH